MSVWIFLDYVSPAGNNLIAKWVEELSIPDRSDMETLLDILSRQRIWDGNDFKWLSGAKYQGLGEIRFKSQQGTPLRLIGVQSHISSNFIFLIGCSHKERKYAPPDALDTAVKRRKLLTSGASVCEHGGV